MYIQLKTTLYKSFEYANKDKFSSFSDAATFIAEWDTCIKHDK